jgi:hypothetical protein
VSSRRIIERLFEVDDLDARLDRAIDGLPRLISYDSADELESGRVYQSLGKELVFVNEIVRGASTYFWTNLECSELFYSGYDPTYGSDGMNMTGVWEGAVELEYDPLNAGVYPTDRKIELCAEYTGDPSFDDDDPDGGDF